MILGAGFDLSWTANPCLSEKDIAYWGDIDTWGLQCLSAARANLSLLSPLMMGRDMFRQFQSSAVPEPIVAGTDIPDVLTNDEKALYRSLLDSEKSRLEQEFLRWSML